MCCWVFGTEPCCVACCVVTIAGCVPVTVRRCRYAWDRNLTDQDGPYVELMAGVYTDNQPDFSFLHPYETRTFTQCWYMPWRVIVCTQEPCPPWLMQCGGREDVHVQDVHVLAGRRIDVDSVATTDASLCTGFPSSRLGLPSRPTWQLPST